MRIRLSPSDLARIKAAALKVHQSTSNFIRHAAALLRAEEVLAEGETGLELLGDYVGMFNSPVTRSARSGAVMAEHLKRRHSQA